ncbi:MAG TPA: hypothetical protein IGS40_17920 [Trichormus sp. M33_DOE_039]|nr:hypothetical protein [Trichormus sp. M33_DOE_039]
MGLIRLVKTAEYQGVSRLECDGDRRDTKLKTIDWRSPNDNAQIWEAGGMNKLAVASLH